MIVSNTTPISNLIHIDRISVLTELFGTVYIPEAVADEVNVIFSSCAEWQKCVESKWSQSIAVGSKSFVEDIKEKLGIRAKGREVAGSKELYHLREAQVPYNSDFTPENSDLRAIKTYCWIDNP